MRAVEPLGMKIFVFGMIAFWVIYVTRMVRKVVVEK